VDYPQSDPFAEGIWGYHTVQATRKRAKEHQKVKTKAISMKKKRQTKRIKDSQESQKG
jgi:hypothetical protein